MLIKLSSFGCDSSKTETPSYQMKRRTEKVLNLIPKTLQIQIFELNCMTQYTQFGKMKQRKESKNVLSKQIKAIT